ncbi:efflux RND transporter periplasmic adaptor subunit [Symmachiella dynata]|uniref:efflux RND transporter periplasmic adaptor subunit n=1 Tax=Symmachiella dynata TaxID=2527995 RepID=UPI0030ED1BBA
MNDSNINPSSSFEEPETPENASPLMDREAESSMQRQETRRWWITLIVQPLLFLIFGALLIVGLGFAQGMGWISAGGGGDSHSHASSEGEATRYICPMMCTPPQEEPGRCPVCAMELVPATSSGGNTDSQSVQIDTAARRVANIQTVSVKSMPMSRTIRAIGELSYDEGTLKTISAYVDGRLERLYADYIGVVVEKGDHLAFVYSPRLYSAQVELLLAKKTRDNNSSATLARVVMANRDLYHNSKQRLIELGMTAPQVEQLELAGEANSRMHLCAPIHGTVIEKYAVEGQYVKEGEPIYKLADLSTVWLMLELFPEDAATIRYGQKVEAIVQSLPERQFTGRVAFIDPKVDPKTRTVGVRVVIPNQNGVLRVGDFAKATIEVPLTRSQDGPGEFYDPELADKWISPRHPHVVESTSGQCRVCGVDLVPATEFGFVSKTTARDDALVVPRDAVLMAGENSVVYVETEPGRFEIRRVVLGPRCGNEMVILSGLEPGEQVATRGNFLIDSQMQLAGNPSLIDPMKAVPKIDEAQSAEIIAALSELTEPDRMLAEKQRRCPVTDFPLGSMGAPPKVDVNGTPVFLCCEGCRESLLEEPEMYLAKLADDSTAMETPADSQQFDLPPIGDFQMIETQEELPNMEAPQETDNDAAENELPPEKPEKRAAKTSREALR